MVLVTVLFTVWFALLIILLVGWRNAMHAKLPEGGGKEPMISVVVPVRNEAESITRLLASLADQEYRNFEVIIVDDGSEDDTVIRVRDAAYHNVKVISSNGKGKKAAISTGVAHARGAIIATTDGDCLVPPSWLRCLRAAFRDKRALLVFGGVRMDGKSFFSTLQAMEFSSLMGSGAATSALGAPTMCNGANLAFRRNAFKAVGGYKGNWHIPTGDDEFLMRAILRRFPGSVRFLNAAEAVVTTEPASSLRAFFHQRVRWASKWRFNNLAGQLLAVFIVSLQVGAIINLALVFTPLILQSLFLLAVKMILEAALLLQVCRFLSIRWRWRGFLLLQVLYPFYVIAVAVSAIFSPYSWKNRTFEPV